MFLAKRFEKAMAEFGTKDEMLMRLAVRCRDPKLMAAIKAAYQQEYSKPLVQRVDGETSGDYGKLLTTIVGN